MTSLVISGIGIISSVGVGYQSLWTAFDEGKSGIAPVSLFDVDDLPAKKAAEIKDFNPKSILWKKGLRLMDRNSLLSLCAAKLAIEDAHLPLDQEPKDNIGVVLSSSFGSISSRADFQFDILKEGSQRVNPNLFPNTVLNVMASQVAIKFGLSGACVSVSSGYNGVFESFEMASSFIESGQIETAIVGGTEELSRFYYELFYSLGFTSVASKTGIEETLAPYSKRRNGTILGEGAALFVLEKKSTAEKRGAPIYAVYGNSFSKCDLSNYRQYAQDPSKAAALIDQTLKQADLSSNDISLISASASGSPDGDRLEGSALKKVFGDTLEELPVTAVKSITGETFSASGGFQVAAGLYAIRRNQIPSTLNSDNPDPECFVKRLVSKPVYCDMNNILVFCVSPMGQNAAMILSKA